jgi:ketosteroid isomerase-like protein
MPSATENEIIAIERQYWQALQDGDIDTIMQLTADPCIVAGAQGVGSLSHEVFRKMMQSSEWTIDSFELTDIQVLAPRDDLAVVAYKVKEVLTVQGKSVTLDASDASTWVRRDGRWLCLLHTESISGDAFGRDRSESTDAPTP